MTKTENAAGVVGRVEQVEALKLSGEGIQGVFKRVLISPAEGWQGWVMRHFELAPAGHTPRHEHDWPHINYVAAGRGQLYLDGELYDLAPGAFAYVPSGHMHQFMAADDEPLAFLCIVPAEGDV